MAPEAAPQAPDKGPSSLEWTANPVNPEEAKDTLEKMDIVDVENDEGRSSVDCTFKMIDANSSEAVRVIKAAEKELGLDHNSAQQYVDPKTGYAYAIIVDSSGKKPKYHIAKTTEKVMGAGEAASGAPEGFKLIKNPKGNDKRALNYAKANIGEAPDMEVTDETGNKVLYIYTADGKLYKPE